MNHRFRYHSVAWPNDVSLYPQLAAARSAYLQLPASFSVGHLEGALNSCWVFVAGLVPTMRVMKTDAVAAQLEMSGSKDGWISIFMSERDLQRMEVLTEVLPERQESSGQAYSAIAGER